MAGVEIRVLDQNGKKTIATAVTDQYGRFQVDVAPGLYQVQSGSTKQYVEVKSGQATTVNFAVPNP
jgi:VCBS repeat-containing protein